MSSGDSHKSGSRLMNGNHCEKWGWGRKIGTIIGELQEAPHGQLQELKTSGGPCHGRGGGGLHLFCKFYSQELDQVLTVNIGEKSPCASGRGRGKRNHFEICQSILFLTGLPSGEIS